MYELIIKNYINNLKEEDIIYFANKNDICLNQSEINYIYKTIKSNYKTLLGNDYQCILNEASNYLKNDNYKKICNLYLDYRNKFKNFLN